jgi:hypothetical protein
MKHTQSCRCESVDYRRSVTELPTAVKVLRVTYTVPLDSTAHEDFASEIDASTHVLMLMRVIRATRRGVVTVQAL